MNIDKILGAISFSGDLLPFVFFLFSLRLLKNRICLVLFIWTFISVIIDIFLALAPQSAYQQLAFYNILIETDFLIIIYYFFVKQKRIKLILLFSGLTFTILSTYLAIFSNFESFPFWLASTAALLTLLMSIAVFYSIFKQNETIFILQIPIIYLVFGYIIYAAGNLFLFLTTEKFPNIFIEPGLWSIFIIANTIKNLFLFKFIIESRKIKP